MNRQTSRESEVISMDCFHDWQYVDDAEMERGVDILLFPVFCANCNKQAKEIWSGYIYVDSEGNEL